MTARLAKHTFTAVKRDQRLIWSVPRLWDLAKKLPVREISLQEFASYLDNDYWFNNGQQASTRAVAEHCRKIIDAKLSFPIILDQEGRLMDGMHRLAKAFLMGRTTVRTVQFPETPPPDRVEDL